MILSNNPAVYPKSAEHGRYELHYFTSNSPEQLLYIHNETGIIHLNDRPIYVFDNDCDKWLHLSFNTEAEALAFIAARQD